MEVTWEIAGGSHWKREKVFLHTLKSASSPEHNNWLGRTRRSGWHSFLCYSRPYYLGQGFSPPAAVGFPASSGQGTTRGIEPHSRFCPYLWEQGKGETLLTHATGTQGWVRETVIRVSCPSHIALTSSFSRHTGQQKAGSPHDVCPIAPYFLLTHSLQTFGQAASSSTVWLGSSSTPCPRWTVATPLVSNRHSLPLPRK